MVTIPAIWSEYYFNLWELICDSIIRSLRLNEIANANRGM